MFFIAYKCKKYYDFVLSFQNFMAKFYLFPVKMLM